MAVDIVLVMRSEHRRVQQLIDRCGRASRGFHDPVQELLQVLRAHMLAATAEIYPSAVKVNPANWPADRLTEVRTLLEREPRADEVTHAAEVLVTAEAEHVLPLLESLEVTARRRLGKVFRIRRDALVRASGNSHRRRRSQTELYEAARRAGVEHRSRMTQAQLHAAIEARGAEA
jgi:hypothetical protein